MIKLVTEDDGSREPIYPRQDPEGRVYGGIPSPPDGSEKHNGFEAALRKSWVSGFNAGLEEAAKIVGSDLRLNGDTIIDASPAHADAILGLVKC